MILGAEIAMLVMGIYAIVTGKLTLTKNKVLRGTPARLVGAIGVLPIPLSIFSVFVAGILFVAQGRNIQSESFQWTGRGIEAAVVIICLIAMYAIGSRFAGPPDNTNVR